MKATAAFSCNNGAMQVVKEKAGEGKRERKTKISFSRQKGNLISPAGKVLMDHSGIGKSPHLQNKIWNGLTERTNPCEERNKIN